MGRYWQLSALIASLVLPPLVATQDFTVPSSWRESNITASQDDRISLTSAAIDKVLSELKAGEFASGTFYTQAAEFDRFTNQTKYKDVVTAYFESDNFDFGATLDYGYYAMLAYATYEEQSMLDLAIRSWNTARFYTISSDQASAGTMSAKSFDITKTCGDASMAGGTFWSTSSTDTTIFGFSTGMFFVLSALLAEAQPSNSSYLTAAQESGQFMISNLLINSNGNGRAAISGNASDLCTVDRFGAGTFRTDDAATFIEGLAILSPTIELASASVWDLRKTAVYNTLTTNAMCNATDGIINVGNGHGSGSLVHGLGTLFRRNTTASGLRNYVRKYLSVQYNAVVDQTTTSGTNIYGASWQGPPSSNYSAANQTLAIHALLNAMVLPDPQTTSVNSGDGDDGNGGNDDGDSPNLAGIIAGSVVGALALIGIIVGAVIVVRRRERKRKDAYDNSFFVDDIAPPEPFTLPMSTATTAPVSGNVQNDTSSIVPVTATTLATHNEKSRLNAPNYTLAWGEPSSTGSRSDVPSTLSDPVVAARSDSRDIPTEELVRLLHDRLQRGELADSTAPPAYDDPAHPR